MPSDRPTREGVARPQEAGALRDALPLGDRAPWATALYAGLRRGELQSPRGCNPRCCRWRSRGRSRGRRLILGGLVSSVLLNLVVVPVLHLRFGWRARDDDHRDASAPPDDGQVPQSQAPEPASEPVGALAPAVYSKPSPVPGGASPEAAAAQRYRDRAAALEIGRRRTVEHELPTTVDYELPTVG